MSESSKMFVCCMFFYATSATVVTLIPPHMTDRYSSPPLPPPTTLLLSRSAFTSKRLHPANYPQSHVWVGKHPDDVIRNESTLNSHSFHCSLSVRGPGRADCIIQTARTQTHAHMKFLKTSFSPKQSLSSWSVLL